MTTGTEILRRAGILLNDEGYDRWTVPELCEWLNEGLKALVLVKPSAKTATRYLSLEAGTLQSLPVVAGEPSPLALLNIVRNIDSLGPPLRPGRVITPTSAAMLNASAPDWHRDSGPTRYRKEVRHFIYDEQAPLEFYVYPGNDGTGTVQALLSVMPTLLVKDDGADGTDVNHYSTPIDLIEVYDPVLVDYVCHRAMSKDAPGLEGRAQGYYSRFATALGIKVQVEGGSSPNNRRGRP